MTRENLYVAMTRGRTANHAYVAIDGVDATCDRLPDPAGDSPGRDILARILATEGAELSSPAPWTTPSPCTTSNPSANPSPPTPQPAAGTPSCPPAISTPTRSP
jgi:hypothetical protein